MHAYELVELAALVAAESCVVIRASRGLDGEGLEEYWTASKCRLDRWARKIKQFDIRMQNACGSPCESLWRNVRPVLEEIVTGEVLTRVWTGVASAIDQRCNIRNAEPIARSVLVGHLEARHRTLQLLLQGSRRGVAQAVALNRLRRGTERWTDLLLGYVMQEHDVSGLAFQASRCRDFCSDLQSQRRAGTSRYAWPILLSSLCATFRPGLCPGSPDVDLNARLGAAVLSCLGPELFESTGPLRSLWQIRLTTTTDETEGLIGELLSPHEPPSGVDRFGARFQGDHTPGV